MIGRRVVGKILERVFNYRISASSLRSAYIMPRRSSSMSATLRDERDAVVSSNSLPSYYMRKRENTEKHDRIKAATIFNTD